MTETLTLENRTIKKKFNLGREIGIIVALILMTILFTAIDPIYINPSNILDIIDQSVINGLLAIGITFTIITGGIDLSIGSTLAIVIVIIGEFLVKGMNPFLAFTLGIFLGFILGAINGLIISKMKLQPFIVTLGTMSIYRGLAYTITGGWPVLNIPDNFRLMVDGTIFGIIPKSIIGLFLLGVMGYFILKRTTIGTYIYAIGGNEEATRLSGVNINRNKLIAYGLSGMGAALAGLVLLARLGTAEPTAGQGYELNAIAAAAIGGTSLAGGKGGIYGTVLGAVLLSALKVGLVVAGVDTFWQFIATGLIIIIASYSEVIQAKLMKKFKK
ncbi:ABC transporter permease [Cetobacterium sp.]|uniref:ABC transporter permease n=1 Tax=Cetobacterium sp. TaxID=2071632 RepID=UPI003F2F3C8C